jgi:hypothetical protein
LHADRAGNCDSGDPALTFWQGVNRYNPMLVGAQYEIQTGAIDDLTATVKRLEERRADLVQQITLLTDALRVLKVEWDQRAQNGEVR